MTRSGPYVEPRPIHPVAAVLLILGLLLLAWAVVLAVMVGSIIVAGPWGPVGVIVAGLAIWRGVR